MKKQQEMRKLVLATVILVLGISTFSTAQKQTDIRVNPLALVFGDFKAGVEFIQNNRLGIELNGGYITGSELLNFESYEEKGFEVGVMAKYYFNSEKVASGYYGSIYGEYARSNFSQDNLSQFTNNSANLGFMLGKKWLYGSGFFIEGAFGVGRSLYNENTPATGSTIDLTTISSRGLQLPGRIAIGIRF